MQWAGNGLQVVAQMQRHIFECSTRKAKLRSLTPIGGTAPLGLQRGNQILPRQPCSFFAATPVSWALSPKTPYPQPIVTAKEGREIALSHYQSRTF